MNRRDLAKRVLVSSLFTTRRRVAATVRAQPPGIKLGSQAPAEPSAEDLTFFKQLGVDVVYCIAVDAALDGRQRPPTGSSSPW